MRYKLVLDSSVLDFFEKQGFERQRRILAWFEKLKTSPFTVGQQVTADETGREIQVCAIPGLLIYHWPEHLAKTIHVVAIEKI